MVPHRDTGKHDTARDRAVTVAASQTMASAVVQGVSKSSDLLSAQDLRALAPLWLRMQIAQSSARGGAVYLEGAGAFHVIAAQGGGAERLLEPVARAALGSGRSSVIRHEDGSGAFVALPVTLDLPSQTGRADVRCAVALSLESAAPARLRAGIQGLTWGVAWLRERMARDALDTVSATIERLYAAHRLMAAVQEPRDARAAALRLSTELSLLLGGDRAVVALRRLTRTEIMAVSHSAEFGKRVRLNRLVVEAMDEALSQRAALTWPEPDDEPNATRAQAALSHDRGGAAVLTVPFRVEGARWGGAVTIERSNPAAFTADEVALVDAAAALAGPALWDKAENQRWLIVKIGQSLRTQFMQLFGPDHAGRKLAMVGVVAATALFSTWTGPYRVTADATVQGSLERSLIAPFDGFVRSAVARPGDQIAQGTVIAALDDRELVLERLRWLTEIRQSELEYGQAIGRRDRAEAELIAAQVEQAEAQLAIIEARIARAQIEMPFDGVIVAGDQTRNIGASVQLGDVLFQIVPDSDYRIVLHVDERRVRDLQAGQRGTMVLGALPGESFALALERVTPVAQASGGRNTFVAEAELLRHSPDLRSGMTGVAKIDIDARLMIDIWTRPLRDWARLTLWSWLG